MPWRRGLQIPATLLEGLFVSEAKELEVSERKSLSKSGGWRIPRLVDFQRPHSLPLPFRKREESLGLEREEGCTGQGFPGAPAGKARDGPSLCSEPSCGALRGSGAAEVIGWFWVAPILMATEGELSADETSSPNEFCIPSDEDTWISLKIAQVEPLLASSFPLSRPEWAPLNLELTKRCRKISFQKIMGLMGFLTNGWGFTFSCSLVWTIFRCFFFKEVPCASLFLIIGSELKGRDSGMSFLWKSDLNLLKWNSSWKLSGF